MLAQKSPARVKSRRCIYSLICWSPALARFARESRKNRNSLSLSKKSYLDLGFAVVVAAATVGGVSGGAFNPAVSMLSVVAGKSATIAVYWAGPALGAVLGLAIFKAAYKGESKKKSKRKTR